MPPSPEDSPPSSPDPAKSQPPIQADPYLSRTPELELEEALKEAESKLQGIQDRYLQMQASRDRQNKLQQQALNPTASSELHQELKGLQEELEGLDNALGLLSQSRLMLTWRGSSIIFSKDDLKETFWQTVRVGGLGVVLGWVLKTWAG